MLDGRLLLNAHSDGARVIFALSDLHGGWARDVARGEQLLGVRPPGSEVGARLARRVREADPPRQRLAALAGAQAPVAANVLADPVIEEAFGAADGNRDVMKIVFVAFRAGIVALGFEVLAWVILLARRA
jgi:hypothetical protein